MLNFKYALVCETVPNTISDGLCTKERKPVAIEKAIEQHKKYLNILQSSGVTLIKINANDKYPDCVFVEDTAIALNDRIFITNLKALSRKGEIEQIAETFRNLEHQLKLKIGYVKKTDTSFIDGGDCLYTGREFIVGISSRTNEEGVEELKDFFQIPVITCTVEKNLHLKSSMSMLDNDTILISTSIGGQSIRKQIESKSKYVGFYKFVEVPSDAAANVLCFNGKVIAPAQHQAQCENVPELMNNSKVVWTDSDEFEKIDGALTCRSIFFNDGLSKENF